MITILIILFLGWVFFKYILNVEYRYQSDDFLYKAISTYDIEELELLRDDFQKWHNSVWKPMIGNDGFGEKMLYILNKIQKLKDRAGREKLTKEENGV